MRTLSRWAAIAVAFGLLAGCAGQTDPAETEAGLTQVRKADFTNRVLYLDLTVSAVPMTSEELGDTTYATPVEVRFYDEWAVAWYAPDGVGLAGHPANAVGVWRVYDNAETTSGDVAPGEGEAETYIAAEPGNVVIPLGSQVGATPTLELPGDDRNILPFATLDWYGQFMTEWQELPPGFHPGCI